MHEPAFRILRRRGPPCVERVAGQRRGSRGRRRGGGSAGRGGVRFALRHPPADEGTHPRIDLAHRLHPEVFPDEPGPDDLPRERPGHRAVAGVHPQRRGGRIVLRVVEDLSRVRRAPPRPRARPARLRRERAAENETHRRRLRRKPRGFHRGRLRGRHRAPGGHRARAGRGVRGTARGAASATRGPPHFMDALGPRERPAAPQPGQPRAHAQQAHLPQPTRPPRDDPRAVRGAGRVRRSRRRDDRNRRGPRDLRATVPGGLRDLPPVPGQDELRSRRGVARGADTDGPAVARAGHRPLLRARPTPAKRQPALHVARRGRGGAVRAAGSPGDGRRRARRRTGKAEGGRRKAEKEKMPR